MLILFFPSLFLATLNDLLYPALQIDGVQECTCFLMFYKSGLAGPTATIH